LRLKFKIFKNRNQTFSLANQNRTVAEVEGEDEVVKTLSCHALFSDNLM
jgi:hypothetical protein